MTRILGIELVGDDKTSVAFKEATASATKFGVTVNEAATKNIERLSAQRVKLQELASEYRKIAATAKIGSAEQVAAADLAAKAQKRLGVEVLATNQAVRVSARDTAASVALSEREIGKFARGAGSASGGFGRTAALSLGSWGFLAGAGVGAAIKASLDASKALAGSEEQLAVAVKNTGGSYRASRAEIDAYLKSESRLSLFTRGDLAASLTQLVRVTGSITKAQKDQALAVDIARGSGRDLASTTQTLVAIEAGRMRGLQVLGVALPKVKTAQDALHNSGLQFTAEQKRQAVALDANANKLIAIDRLTQKYTGSAKKYADSNASATDRLHTSIKTLEESIGTALLPTVSNLVKPFADWAQKEADSGDAARKVEGAVKDLVAVAKTAKTVIHDVDDVTGGFKHTLELLLALKFAGTLTGWSKELKLFSVATGEKGAAGKVALLTSRLTALSAIGVITIPIVIDLIENLIKDFKSKHDLGKSTGTGGQSGRVVEQNGKYYLVSAQNAGRGGPGGMHEITKKQAESLLGKSVTTGPNQAAIGGKSLAGEDPHIKEGLQALANAGYKVDVTSALRTRAQQAALYKRYQDSGFNIKYIAAKPGTSNHERGKAVDVYVNGKPVDQTPAALAILKKYGLVSDVPGDHEHLDLVGSSGRGSKAANDAVKKLLQQGTQKPKKPVTLHGVSLLGDTLANRISTDADNASTSSGAAALAWLHKEKAALQDAQKKLKDELAHAGTGKQKAAIEAETRTINSQLAGVNKSITANLKQQAAAIKAAYKPQIAAATAAITSAFGQLITDVRSAFEEQTSAYITATIGPKYFQGLLNPKEQQLADMQAQDTAQSLADSLTAAQKQLADDMNGSLIEHIVDVHTGSVRDIFGNKGTPDQIATDKAAIASAQRQIDENALSIQASKDRADEDKTYADAVKQYQQERSLAEASMTRDLTQFGKDLADGGVHLSDLSGELAKFGVDLALIPSDQWSTDVDTLITATQALAKVFADEATALGGVGAVKDALVATAKATGLLGGSPITDELQPFTPGSLGAQGYFLLNRPVPHMATGGDILRDGLIYAHRGERVQPAEVVRGSGGGGGHTFNFNIPNYVGSHRELAKVLKGELKEAVATSVILASRGGHIRQSDIRP